MKNNIKVRIPEITGIDTAIRLFYEKIELTNSDIIKLFGKHSNSTITRLKKKAREQMAADNVTVWNDLRINTASAYKAWGINVKDLEYRRAMLLQLAETDNDNEADTKAETDTERK